MNLTTSLILFLNVTLLSILVPGGPVENRDFDYLKKTPSIYYGFSIFLISLILISLALCYFVLLDNLWAFKVSLAAGALYFMVYILDLLKIFPRSPTPMSKMLMLIEIINMMLALLLVIFFSGQTVYLKQHLHFIIKTSQKNSATYIPNV